MYGNMPRDLKRDRRSRDEIELDREIIRDELKLMRREDRASKPSTKERVKGWVGDLDRYYNC